MTASHAPDVIPSVLIGILLLKRGLSLVCPVTRGDVDPVPATINFCFAEDLAVIPFERYPGDGEPVGLRVASEGEGDFIANRNPRWQGYLMIGSARAGHQPVQMFGQYTWAAWLDRTDCVGLSRQAGTRNSNHEPGDPRAKHIARPIDICDHVFDDVSRYPVFLTIFEAQIRGFCLGAESLGNHARSPASSCCLATRKPDRDMPSEHHATAAVPTLRMPSRNSPCAPMTVLKTRSTPTWLARTGRCARLKSLLAPYHAEEIVDCRSARGPATSRTTNRTLIEPVAA
jgi:hypothetical protein